MQKEINKLLKRINAEKLKNNHKECVELYNEVAGLYSDIGSYDEAVHYHEEALQLSKTIGDRLGTAVAFRYIGEAKAALGQFHQATEHIKRYLDLAQKINNKVEVQRAYTTLGRVYLMQAQDMKDNSNMVDESVKGIAQEAEKQFKTALTLAESVKDQVEADEFSQMRIRLLINIGLVKDICGQFAGNELCEAIRLCGKTAKLKEDLYRCQIILSGIYRQRDNLKMAAKVSEEAFNTAKSIGKKILICDALLERGFVKLCLRDFKSAKRSFVEAYLEKSPNEEDHAKAIKLTKLTHLVAVSFEELNSDNITSETRLKLCDKLGDLTVALGLYKLASEFYRRAFTEARICSKSSNELARILYSRAETYADDGQFEHALVCFSKELEIRERIGNLSEQCQTLIKIAHMHEYLKHSDEEVSESYERALDKAGKDPKLMYNVLKYYVPYMKKKSFNNTRMKELENILMNLSSYPEVLEEIECEDMEELNELEDEIANIDDIITDDEDNDEVLMIRGKRKLRIGGKKFKPNEVGDTPLHEACIKGDIKRVKSLISQGHEVNPRDNAGWIPLHEACNHGHYEIVEYLIEHGADVCNRGLKGMSPLHDAATNGHFEIMRLLIKNGANVIALTDTGETVLGCFRDYKKRNYSGMSNREQSEYKQMEAELLNIMDRSGFNLMTENIKNLGSKSSGTSSSRLESALEEEEVRPVVRTKERLNVLESNPLANSVKDYRDAISTLKRKRATHEKSPDTSKKPANLPATYHTSTSTSLQTKEWLIDDVSREKRVLANRGAELPMFSLEDFEDDFEEDEDTDIRGGGYNRDQVRHIDENSDDEIEICGETRAEEAKSSCDDPVIINDDFDDDFGHHREPFNDESSASLINRQQSCSPNTLISNNSSFYHQPTFNLFAKPLQVLIEGRKLLIPIKEENSTVGWLKKTIAERYSSLIGTKPNVSIAPASDQMCTLFDADLCQDVIQESEIFAKIESWQLESIEKTYLSNCVKSGIEVPNFMKLQMRIIDESGNKLDLSYTNFPKSHSKPVLISLERRNFTYVDLTGVNSLFLNEQDWFNTISSWKQLTNLCLKCVGLKRGHFEALCTKAKLPELKSVDVSFNAILYKCQEEFKNPIESLMGASPKLKRLDIRKNHLQFGCLERVKSAEFGQELEILGSDQNDYCAYVCSA